MTKKIVFTGGGSAGHVSLNKNLIPFFIKDNWDVFYIGSYQGIEKSIISNIDDVKYYPISTGKLRRYVSFNNIIDFIKIPIGIIQAYFIIKKINPDIIFSKGGFVSFPVIVAGFLNNVKIIMHESDITPGLANKLSLPFVTRFFTTFERTINNISSKYKSKVFNIGAAINTHICNGNTENYIKNSGFSKAKPIILAFGGSLGAASINKSIRDNLDNLTSNYQIIHICGKNQLDSSINNPQYIQYEFVDKDMCNILSAADLVISRAGSNSIFELLYLNKPMILVPLPNTSSRGEQSLNAQDFQSKGYCEIIKDEDINNSNILLSTIEKVYNNKEYYVNNMKNNKIKMTTTQQIYEEIIR